LIKSVNICLFQSMVNIHFENSSLQIIICIWVRGLCIADRPINLFILLLVFCIFCRGFVSVLKTMISNIETEMKAFRNWNAHNFFFFMYFTTYVLETKHISSTYILYICTTSYLFVAYIMYILQHYTGSGIHYCMS
jgi:hypothetical protein